MVVPHGLYNFPLPTLFPPRCSSAIGPTNILTYCQQRCRVVDHEVSESEAGEDSSEGDAPLLHVQAFTPLLGTLLLNAGSTVGAPARMCVVNLLARIREARTQNGADIGYFGPSERKMFEREIIQQVVIGMAHLEAGAGNGFGNREVNSGAQQHAGATPAVTDYASPDVQPFGQEEGEEEELLHSPVPPSATDDETMVSTLSSTSFSLQTAAFLAEPALPSPSETAAANALAAIERPPSPLPTATMGLSSQPQTQMGGHMSMPLSEIEPEFAHIVSQQHSDDMMLDYPSPVRSSTPPAIMSSRVMPPAEVHRQDGVLSPQPQHPTNYQPAAEPEALSLPFQPGGDGSSLTEGDFNEEQAAVGRLASMSLMAAVTASGKLLLFILLCAAKKK